MLSRPRLFQPRDHRQSVLWRQNRSIECLQAGFADERAFRGILCYHNPMANGTDLNWIASYIWGIADDVLGDVYVRGK